MSYFVTPFSVDLLPSKALRTSSPELQFPGSRRFITRHQAIVKVTRVTGTRLNGRIWQARLQALVGTFTGLESRVGSSGWGTKPGTLRESGY
jgi:hypothetical protein